MYFTNFTNYRKLFEPIWRRDDCQFVGPVRISILAALLDRRGVRASWIENGVFPFFGNH